MNLPKYKKDLDSIDILTSKDEEIMSPDMLDMKKKIKFIFVGAIIVWTLIIIFGHLYKNSFVCIIPLSIPYITFIINYNSCITNVDDTNKELKADVLNYIFISSAILTTWIVTKDKKTLNRKTLGWFLISLVLLVLSMIDINVCKKNKIYKRHFDSSIHTMSISLLTFVIIEHYYRITQ